MRCRMRDRRVTTCAPRLAPRCATCVAGQIASRSDRGRQRRCLLTKSLRPSRNRFGHPSHRPNVPCGLEAPTTRRAGRRLTSDAASRKTAPLEESRCLLPERNPYATVDCSIVRARTAAPSRDLERGVAQELARLSYLSPCPLLTKKASGKDSGIVVFFGTNSSRTR